MAQSRLLNIVNTRGLHARASAKFVQCAEKYDAVIKVSKDGTSVSGTSIMGLMMLAAGPGCCILIEATGAQADAALDALEALVTDGFGERD
jgi:phosphocarrier protein